MGALKASITNFCFGDTEIRNIDEENYPLEFHYAIKANVCNIYLFEDILCNEFGLTLS